MNRENLQFSHMGGEKLIFAIYLLGFAILALSLALFQPLADTPPLYGNPPDEHARYLIPKYICEHGVVPTGLEEEVRIPAYGFSYGLYNVFPYILQGYVMRFVNYFTDSEAALLYSARMVNVVFGMAMAAIVYLTSRRVFKDFCFRWLFCFAVMYFPECLFLHTYVNTDSCCLLSTAMMVYALVRCYQEGITIRNSLWMSGGIILCALSYYNAYGYILSCILLFLAYFLQKKDGHLGYDWRQMLKKGCFISTVVLLGIGWWFVRSFLVLDGDILGLATRREMAVQYAIESVNPLTMQTYRDMGYSVWEMIRERNMLRKIFFSFVAAYGSMSIYGSIWMYRAYGLFFGAGILGILYYLCRRRERRQIGGREIFFHANMLFCILMPAALTLYYAYAVEYQGQGRYLLPSLVPLMCYVVKGIEKLAGMHWKQRRLPRWLLSCGVFLCFALIIGSALHMVYWHGMPVYRETGMVLEQQ